jgi:hypothetical protein
MLETMLQSSSCGGDDYVERFYVATLALVRYQGKGLQRCKLRVKPRSHISCSQECRRV